MCPRPEQHTVRHKYTSMKQRIFMSSCCVDSAVETGISLLRGADHLIQEIDELALIALA